MTRVIDIVQAHLEANGFDGLVAVNPMQDETDAARYRALRRGQHWSVINGIGDALRDDELDAAIDTALMRFNAEPNGAQHPARLPS